MRIWHNKVSQSQRTLTEIEKSPVSIGRDSDNDLVLASPMVSRRHALIHQVGETLTLENVGLNSCLVGEQEILGGQKAEIKPGQKVRLWPFTLTFETHNDEPVSPGEYEAHLRGVLADLERRIHKTLLERLDLYELQSRRAGDRESILVLERNVEDACRELSLFDPSNESLLIELVGLGLRDLVINQLILERGPEDDLDGLALSTNEFDVPATLAPEREAELADIAHQLRERLRLKNRPDLSAKIHAVESRFADVFPYLRPHLYRELCRYVLLRMVKKDLKDVVFGYGPLQDLLRAPTVSEIMVVSSDQIFVERDGVIESSGRRFLSDKVTESIIERIVARVGRRIDKSQPLVDARLPDGSRVNAIIPPLATRGPCLTIRKFPARRWTVDDLVENGAITRSAAEFLRAAVVDRRNVLISGGTGSGKTTLLNVLSAFIPYRERIVTIEDTGELRLHQEHVVQLEARPASVEGTGAVTIRDLVRNALRMRPDRIVVGECRGAEALDMIQAMNTGHDGSMTTLHANSAREVIERLEVLILTAADLPISSIHRQIASAVDVIVHIRRFPDGCRAVTQISEVIRVDEERREVVMTDLYLSRGERGLTPTGALPTFIESLLEKRLLELDFLHDPVGKAPGENAGDDPIRIPLKARDQTPSLLQ